MEECLDSDYHTGGFYGRPVNSLSRNGSLLLIASPLLIMTPMKARKVHSKRKHEHIAKYQPSHVENCLVQLCRGNRWIDAANRCRYFPEEACPVLIRDNVAISDNAFYSTKRTSIQSGHSGDSNTLPLFRETALGIICASKSIGTKEGKQVILALLHENPNQVGASQHILGHTPLREAILNGCCTVEIFRILVEAASTSTGADLTLHLKDKNGSTPIDHLMTSIQLGASPDSVSMLKDFLRIKQSVNIASSLKDHTSPLIRLLTTGNSFCLSGSPIKARKVSRKHRPRELDNGTLRLQRVLHATKILLDDDPGLLYRSSNVTKCTPLHVALRNYGNFAPLIKELLDRDNGNKMVQASNYYGDLPLHVACSVGVPFDVLGLVIEKTAHIQDVTSYDHNPLVWSSNKLGYTPVDLEWISHIEAGYGLYAARHFCPSDATASRQHCFKQDVYYRELLKESVNEVTRRGDCVNNREKTKHGDESRKEEVEIVFGCLLDRISLLIRMESSTTKSKFDANANNCTKLNHLCQLGTPYSARLPLPMLELFLWLCPEEIIEKDQKGFLPIHHALRYGTMTFGRQNSSATLLPLRAIDDWKSFVFLLLDKTSQQCKVKSREGRLPLHYVLDHTLVSTSSRAPTSDDATSATSKALQLSRHLIIEKLVDLYPGSVNIKDPVTGLYPFMMASLDKAVPLNTTFFILRRSPPRCVSLVKTQKNCAT